MWSCVLIQLERRLDWFVHMRPGHTPSLRKYLLQECCLCEALHARVESALHAVHLVTDSVKAGGPGVPSIKVTPEVPGPVRGCEDVMSVVSLCCMPGMGSSAGGVWYQQLLGPLLPSLLCSSSIPMASVASQRVACSVPSSIARRRQAACCCAVGPALRCAFLPLTF